MTIQSGVNKQVCLLNANAQCDAIWVAQTNGLSLSHLQTLRDAEPMLEGRDALGDDSYPQIGAYTAYQQCVRGCMGPRL